TAGSISPGSRTTRGVNSTPNDGATPWIAANWPIPTGVRESRRTATRLTCGATCLSSSSHLTLRPYSYAENPVVLPPGRAKLATRPAPTGSISPANTIGTAKGLRRLQIDDEFELGCLNNRKVSRLCAQEDAAGVDADLTEHVGDVGAITHQ